MNEATLIQKVWNYATVLKNEGVHYGSYISEISFLLFLKMDEERVGPDRRAIDAAKGLPLESDQGRVGQLLADTYGTGVSEAVPNRTA